MDRKQMIIENGKKDNLRKKLPNFLRINIVSNPSSYALRFKNLWIAIGWASVAWIIITSLMPAPKSIQTISLFHGDKVMHVMAYFVLMGWFAQIYHAPRERFYYLIGLMLLGLVLEILQGLGGLRQWDVLDILANIVGVLLAWQFTKKRFANLLASFEQTVLLRE
jgi:VanZ family protein